MIVKPAVQKLDLRSLHQGSTQINWDEFYGPAGKEHYKLLAWIGSYFNERDIFDIGTHRGASALALSINPTNQIHSFDIEHKYPLPTRTNVAFYKEDLFELATRTKWEEKLLNSACIFLDIDPHEGTRELQLIQWLQEQNYKGFIICDDIWYFKPMRDNFWYKVPHMYRIDITDLGHWSGTGIIRFNASELWPFSDSLPNDRTTVVTGYFDLTKMPDASRSIKARPAEHYLANARATMAVTQPLVVFCEPESTEKLRAMRPADLLDKTKFIEISFEEFAMTKHRQKIIDDRLKRGYNADDRNTASYYLLCMARYDMLKRVMDTNPFKTEHFAWLNICIERMGWRNVAALEGVIRAPRTKVSTCFIDYQPEALVRNLPEYFKWGRCSLCSGFFTGRKDFLGPFCSAVEEKFLEALEAGFGHADEQLFAMVYFDHREKMFEPYYGDYQEMITNYFEPRDRPGEPIRLLIAHSFAAKDWRVCLAGCEAVWRGFKKGVTSLSSEQLQELVRIYRAALEATEQSPALP